MVPAVLLELVRAHAALDEPEAALEAADRARERLAGARDAGALAAALDALAGGGRGPRDGVAPEELSARELEVLAALAGPGSLRQVADALFISRNTIKTHTRALYAKLGVASREEAVRRGRELGLVEGAPLAAGGMRR